VRFSRAAQGGAAKGGLGGPYDCRKLKGFGRGRRPRRPAERVVESPRTGRPTDNPKRNAYRIMMTDDELKKLEYCCGFAKLSKADVLRLGIDKVYTELKNKEIKVIH